MTTEDRALREIAAEPAHSAPLDDEPGMALLGGRPPSTARTASARTVRAASARTGHAGCADVAFG